MLFQSHHMIFIFTYITQIALAQNNPTIQCKGGFTTNMTEARCDDKDLSEYICPTSQCGNNGHLWVQMVGCLHNGVIGSGISNQQCSSYHFEKVNDYGCTNPGGEWYSCPYKIDNVPFITCSNCTMPKATGVGP
ncbi:uncharacterized protein MELLADRAFT_104560 [Melampsora larici-populina 98AG31]|uniref:Secreted protein n=1 Tax=Melampsora larici-populina (strain 98AG31 / pathotype 3-4-7) TaxID=747676 RepID=F4RF41_MELLP|nr:uncharacterized protein MELLADRAFT_104560 [Melampsora larici-populina 98AG31]EGG09005.1 secreted protein [Melampsora larici-populina 98AG31]